MTYKFRLETKQEETRMLEMTIGTLQRENIAKENQVNDSSLLYDSLLIIYDS